MPPWVLPTIFVLASFGTAGVILVRKFPQLSLLDVESLPEVKEEKKKDEFLKQRVEKEAIQAKKERGVRWQPLWQLLKRIQIRFRRYVGAVERSVRADMQSFRPVSPEKIEERHEQLRTLLSAATFAFEQGDFDTAEKKFLSAIRLDAKSKEAYRGLGDIYAKQGQMNEAIETYLFVHHIDPDDDHVLVRLAELSEAAGKLNDAVGYYEQALLLNDNISVRFARLGELLLSMDQPEPALEAIEQALDLEPENPKYLDMLVETSIIVGNKDLAEEGYQRLRMVNPENQKLAVLKDRIEKI
jgi:tetratricopeptide (TPR) repeat protein